MSLSSGTLTIERFRQLASSQVVVRATIIVPESSYFFIGLELCSVVGEDLVGVIYDYRTNIADKSLDMSAGPYYCEPAESGLQKTLTSWGKSWPEYVACGDAVCIVLAKGLNEASRVPHTSTDWRFLQAMALAVRFVGDIPQLRKTGVSEHVKGNFKVLCARASRFLFDQNKKFDEALTALGVNH